MDASGELPQQAPEEHGDAAESQPDGADTSQQDAPEPLQPIQRSPSRWIRADPLPNRGKTDAVEADGQRSEAGTEHGEQEAPCEAPSTLVQQEWREHYAAEDDPAEQAGLTQKPAQRWQDGAAGVEDRTAEALRLVLEPAADV